MQVGTLTTFSLDLTIAYQKLPCTFELEVPGLGILEGNPGENIKAGTRIDLPLWLGVMLSIGSGPCAACAIDEVDSR
jgi:hypothetical protein